MSDGHLILSLKSRSSHHVELVRSKRSRTTKLREVGKGYGCLLSPPMEIEQLIMSFCQVELHFAPEMKFQIFSLDSALAYNSGETQAD